MGSDIILNNTIRINSYFLTKEIFNQTNLKNNRFRLKLTICLYILFKYCSNEYNSFQYIFNKPAGFSISLLEIYEECFLGRDKRYTIKILKDAFQDLIDNGIGDFQLYCFINNNGNNSENLKDNTQIHINEFSSSIFPLANKANVLFKRKEFLKIINLCSKSYSSNSQSGKIKVESLLTIFLYLKYIDYISNSKSRSKKVAFEISYRTINKYTGINYHSVKKYTDFLENNEMLYSFWLGNYIKNIDNKTVIQAAPTIYTLTKNYGAMVRKTIQLKKTLIGINASNSDNNSQDAIYFSQAGELFGRWQKEKEQERNK